MREIKFRAWDKENKKMYCVWVMACSSEDNSWQDGWFGNVSDKELIYKNAVQLELMQYTGLKDKNGKEIYEGDYIHEAVTECFGSFNIPDDCIGREYQRDEFDGVVIFRDGMFGTETEDYGFVSIIPNATELEVIGNIYENPELLNKK